MTDAAYSITTLSAPSGCSKTVLRGTKYEGPLLFQVGPMSAPSFVRGTTILFSTTFTDFYGNVVQPGSGTVEIAYQDPNGNELTVSLPMTAPTGPPPLDQWTAEWDTRGAGVGAVSYSIHSDPGLPFAVEDGELVLCANQANLVTFT